MDTTETCFEERVDIGFDQEAVSEAQIVVLAVSGMKCSNCANRVHNGLVRTPGVLWSAVDLETARVFVAFVGDLTALSDLTTAVITAGFISNHTYSARVLEVVEALTPAG